MSVRPSVRMYIYLMPVVNEIGNSCMYSGGKIDPNRLKDTSVLQHNLRSSTIK